MPANPNGVHVVCDEWVVHENHTVDTQWALLDWYQVQRTVCTCQPVSKLSIFQENLLTAQGYVAELEPSTWGGSDAQWLNGYHAGLWTERCGFEPWPGPLCCVLGQDALLSQCLSPPRCING